MRALQHGKKLVHLVVLLAGPSRSTSSSSSKDVHEVARLAVLDRRASHRRSERGDRCSSRLLLVLLEELGEPRASWSAFLPSSRGDDGRRRLDGRGGEDCRVSEKVGWSIGRGEEGSGGRGRLRSRGQVVEHA